MIDFVMLVCAVLAALALGVLTAYAVTMGMFRLFRMRVQHTKEPVRVGSGAKIVEG